MISVRNGGTRRARLAGLGAHVPERVVTNAEMETRVETSDDWIVARTGIRERRFAGPDEATSDMAVPAAERALADADLDPADLDMVIVATASPDHLFPSTAALVADRIGARNAAAYDLLAACTGFIYGLAQASALVESGVARNVLVVGAETLSRITDQTDRATCVLFADGAGAGLIRSGPIEGTGFVGFELGADGSGGDLLAVPAGGSRMPTATISDPRDAFIGMKGAEVFRFATRIMVESTDRLLRAAEMSIDDIDLVVAHQANVRIIEHAAERLGIEDDKLFVNIDRYGNTSSASIPLALVEAREAGRLRPGDLLLLVGFGGGLTWGSTIVRWEPEGWTE